MPSTVQPDPAAPESDPAATAADAAKAHQEALLEEAFEKSFPANDPNAIDVTH